ncbi:MAG: efflux RND transporter periplasmic adaptor subunit [Phycisphaeraceae bacterium]|nr:MAG: efflux RND transporter periplasmic adaptor subunit [Phycisphaeraceae bacterium]
MWKWFLGLLVIVVVGCAGSGYWLTRAGILEEVRSKLRPDLKATKVRVGAVERGDLIRVVSAPGYIEPRTKVDISAQVSARIVALPFREGQRARKGETLVRLESDDLQALLDSARASLRSEESRLEGVRATYEQADRDLRRQRELLGSKDIAPQVYEAAEARWLELKSALEQVERSIDIARANIKRAEKDLANTVISAPFDGVISQLNAEVGELVVVGTLNSPGSVIMRFSDLSRMLMRARIDEANIMPVEGGQRCRVYINAFPGSVYRGVVERVRPTRQVGSDQTAYFETEIAVELPEDNALSGMLANVDVEVETLAGVLKVPSQAVVDRAVDDLPAALRESPLVDSGKKYVRVVWTIEGGRARATPVIAGASDLTHTVVVQGVAEGSSIIIGPYKTLLSLKHEQRVEDDRGEGNGSGGAGDGVGASRASSGGGTSGGG